MNFTVPKKDFLRLVARAASVADRKSTMPILSSVLVAAADGEVRVSGSDLYVTATGACAAEVRDAGSVALPARDLLDRVKSMPDGPLVVEIEKHTTIIRSTTAKRRHTVHHVPGSEFPKLPSPSDSAESSRIPCEALANIIARSSYAIRVEEDRPEQNALLLSWGEGVLTATATNAHQLARVEFKADHSGRGEVLVPLRGVRALAALVEAGGDAELIVDGTNLYADAGGVRLSVKLCVGRFPPWRQILPKTFERKCTISRAALTDAVKSAMLSASALSGALRMTFSAAELGIIGESPSSGTSADSVPCDMTGKDILVGMCARYVLETLAVMSAEDIAIEIHDDMNPIIFRDGPKFFAIVMPLRV